MMPVKSLAIVLRTVPFGETSCVVTLLTREFGKLRGLAKGAWRPKSGFDAALDLLSICEVLVLRKSSGGLDLVTEASLERRFRVEDLFSFHAALHLAEVVDGLTAEGDPHAELFDAVATALTELSARPEPALPGPSPAGRQAADHRGRAAAVLARTELAILRLLGHGPSLRRCAACRGAVEPGPRFSFGMLDGGLLCPRCRRGRRSVVSISGAVLDAMRRLETDPGGIREMPEGVAGELRAVMNTLFSHLLERRLRVAPRLTVARSFGPLLIAMSLAVSGCASFKTPTWPWGSQAAVDAAAEPGEESDVISSEFSEPEDLGWDYFKGENIKRRWKKMVGRGPNEPIARKALEEGDSLFREGKYAEAIPKYKLAVDRWPDSAIEEDALWQLAECYFFLDKYPKAEDCYDDLVKKFANTRHLDRIAQRQFVIADYWLKLDAKHDYWTIVPNLVDRSRPLFDTRGRAIKAFDHVRINDPRGPLADDSIMAQANAYFLNREWLDADYYYGLLRTEYPDSDFLLQAHLFGLQAKLQAYQGPGYEGGILEEAELLADQTLVQFPDRLVGEERDRVMKTRAEVAAQQAMRHWRRAEFYEKGRHYTSARIYYALIARDQPQTLLASQAREKLQTLAGKQDVSDDPFPLLTRVLNPDSLKEAELDAMAEAETVQTASAADSSLVPPTGTPAIR